MKLKEFFSGTEEEQQAKKLMKMLRKKPRLTEQGKKKLKEYTTINRKRIWRIVGPPAALAVLGVAGAIILGNDSHTAPTFESDANEVESIKMPNIQITDVVWDDARKQQYLEDRFKDPSMPEKLHQEFQKLLDERLPRIEALDDPTERESEIKNFIGQTIAWYWRFAGEEPKKSLDTNSPEYGSLIVKINTALAPYGYFIEHRHFGGNDFRVSIATIDSATMVDVDGYLLPSFRTDKIISLNANRDKDRVYISNHYIKGGDFAIVIGNEEERDKVTQEKIDYYNGTCEKLGIQPKKFDIEALKGIPEKVALEHEAMHRYLFKEGLDGEDLMASLEKPILLDMGEYMLSPTEYPDLNILSIHELIAIAHGLEISGDFAPIVLMIASGYSEEKIGITYMLFRQLLIRELSNAGLSDAIPQIGVVDLMELIAMAMNRLPNEKFHEIGSRLKKTGMQLADEYLKSKKR